MSFAFCLTVCILCFQCLFVCISFFSPFSLFHTLWWPLLLLFVVLLSAKQAGQAGWTGIVLHVCLSCPNVSLLQQCSSNECVPLERVFIWNRFSFWWSSVLLTKNTCRSFLKQASKGIIAAIKMTEWYIPKDNNHTVNLVWPSVSVSLRGATEAQSTVNLKALVLFSSTAILSWWRSDRLCYRKRGIVTKTSPGFFSLNVHLTVVSGCLEIKFCQQKPPQRSPVPMLWNGKPSPQLVRRFILWLQQSSA